MYSPRLEPLGPGDRVRPERDLIRVARAQQVEQVLRQHIREPAAPAINPPRTSRVMPEQLTLYVIVDLATPRETWEQLERACSHHQITAREVIAEQTDLTTTRTLPPGSMLYRAGTSQLACVIEQLMCGANVATLYAHPLGPHIIYDSQLLWLQRLGIPTPRAIHAVTDDPQTLREQVEHLGGFPIVLKVPGRSHGVGVIKAKDLESLFAVTDLAYATSGEHGLLMQCIEPAEHWRVIGVGASVAAAYINPQRPDDFRTHVDADAPAHFTSTPPEAVVSAALDAMAALGIEVGGVDVLCGGDGRVYVLEVNNPSYFGHPWEVARIDVAGAIIAHLSAKARGLLDALE